MNEVSARLLEVAKVGLRELGYTEGLLREDYPFADFDTKRPGVRRIPLAAFGHSPTSFESAWIGVTVGLEDAQSLRRFRSLGAPQILVLNTDSVGLWTMPARGDPVLQEQFPSPGLQDAIRQRRSVWGRQAVARAKTISFGAEPLQLDFYDAGLVPAIEAVVRKKLDRLLGDVLARVLKAHQEHLPGDADLPGIYRLVFRLLAAKLLADRGHPGDWAKGEPSDVVSRIERYYYGSQPIPPAVRHPEVQGVAWRYIQRGFHLQNVSVRTLAYIYENTLVSGDARKLHSIHGTPPEIAEFVVRRLPLENLALEDRRVFEPFAGHAVFLIAALGRLRELLEPGLSDAERHGYFVRMLAGIEAEQFAIEVARLSLMLADYPNPDGWELVRGDVFSGTELADRLSRSNVVLCNPPFEDFPIDSRARYQGLRSVNQAAEILTRVLDHPPDQLAFVLPRVFRDGVAFRGVRKRLVETYGTIELIELPDKTFSHSDVETVLLLAHGPNRGHIDLRSATVRRPDLQRFLTTGEPTRASNDRIPTGDAAAMSELWQFPLKRVWDALRGCPTLGAVAEVHRGIEYRLPLKGNWDQLVSTTTRKGFLPGLINVSDRFEPFRTSPGYHLNMTPGVMRGLAYRSRWNAPKVIANANRQTRGPWPVIAVPDRRGLVLYQNFHGIWPTADWPIEVIAAVLNGYVANAFIDLREEKRHNRVRTINAVPLPRLSRADLLSIANLVRRYEGLREAMAEDRSEGLANRCREALSEIDIAVLQAYELPRDAESDLIQHFAGATRPGPKHDPGIGGPRPEFDIELPFGASRSAVAGIYGPDVSRVLRERPALAAVIQEAADQLGRFIPDARLDLEFITDPDDKGEQLFLGVSTNLEVREALSALHRFDEEWWVHQVRRAGGFLCIDLRDQ